jgi:hypothetical protein
MLTTTMMMMMLMTTMIVVAGQAFVSAAGGAVGRGRVPGGSDGDLQVAPRGPPEHQARAAQGRGKREKGV